MSEQEHEQHRAGHDHAGKDIEFHRRVADIYDYVTHEPRAYPNDLLFAPIDRALKPGGAMLDLGCGTGQMVIRYGRDFESVTGVDHSPDMLAVARKKADARRWTHARFEKADLHEWLATDQKSYQLITCVGVLHHLEPDELAETLAAIRTRLADGGQAVLAEPVDDSAHPEPAWVQRWNRKSALVQRLDETGFWHIEEPDEAPLALTDFRAAIAGAGLRTQVESRGWELFPRRLPPGPVERMFLRAAQAISGQHGNTIALLVEVR
ncbi:MAG: class I SAM-dependent methyltransferase [Xanthomonadales bacterium]|nr:class I SAM-dependent methyltransferase [Xanthomonadales bacterium]